MSSWIESAAVAALTVFTAALAMIAWRAYTYRQSPRILFVASGFTILFLKAVVITLALFLQPPWAQDLVLAIVLFDLAVVLAFYLGLAQRARP